MPTKGRFNLSDVVRMSEELNASLSGMWVQNIYTTMEDSAKVFIFKLTSATSQEGKAMLLLESGVRFHLTDFEREKSTFPAPFAMKLRKHVREKRLLYVKQIGIDRVVDFCFGKGDSVYHVVLELYASGNVILTEKDGKILSLLRVYSLEEGDSEIKRRVAVGQIYPLNAEDINASSLSLSVLKCAENDDDEANVIRMTEEVLREREQKKEEDGKKKMKNKSKTNNNQEEDGEANVEEKKESAKKSNPQSTLVNLLTMKGSPYQAFGPVIMSDVLQICNIDPNTIPAPLPLVRTINPELRKYFAHLKSSSVLPGFIVCASALYESFEPIRPLSLAPSQSLATFASFSKAVDEYFSKLEAVKWEKAKRGEARAVDTKIQTIRKQQEERVDGLLQSVEKKERVSAALLENVELVDQAIGAVNSLLQNGYKWEEIENVIESERKLKNPVASVIRKLHLSKNVMEISLPNMPQKETLEVDLSLSAYANASKLFSEKKQAAKKAEVTVEKTREILKTLQVKGEKQLEKKLNQKIGQQIKSAHKPLWFEKFHWFISSDGVLVVGGKDAQQNELLVKKYLRSSDIYLHAELNGAPSCIARNPSKSLPIPETSLSQAATFCVCKSSAWNSKILAGAWYAAMCYEETRINKRRWVHADQVSKAAPSGEFLPTGSFMIRGKKNFIQPQRLEMGFGYLFRVDRTGEGAESREREWRFLRAAVGGNEGDKGDKGDKVDKVDKVDKGDKVDDEEDVEENGDKEDKDKAAQSDESAVLLDFTCNPQSEDVIIEAIPFCGPIQAMNLFKFRVKLVPGKEKKGKSCTQALNLFVSKATNQREKEAMLMVSEPQNVAVMIGDVKISAAGFESLKSKMKEKKKEEMNKGEEEEEEAG